MDELTEPFRSCCQQG